MLIVATSGEYNFGGKDVKNLSNIFITLKFLLLL